MNRSCSILFGTILALLSPSVSGSLSSSYATLTTSTEPSQTAASGVTYNFDNDTVGKISAGFTNALTGRGAIGEWRVISDPTAPSPPNVLAQTSSDSTDYRFPLAILDEDTFRDLNLSVKFKTIGGRVDRAAGVIFRVKDSNNYYIARANALENNYVLFRVVNGRRTPVASAHFKVASGEWHELRIECVGNRITCFYDEQKKVEADDSTFKEAGRVGLWTKADSVTYFDDLKISGK